MFRRVLQRVFVLNHLGAGSEIAWQRIILFSLYILFVLLSFTLKQGCTVHNLRTVPDVFFCVSLAASFMCKKIIAKFKQHL